MITSACILVLVVLLISSPLLWRNCRNARRSLKSYCIPFQPISAQLCTVDLLVRRCLSIPHDTWMLKSSVCKLPSRAYNAVFLLAAVGHCLTKGRSEAYRPTLEREIDTMLTKLCAHSFACCQRAELCLLGYALLSFYRVWGKSHYIEKASEIFALLNEWKEGNHEKVVPYGPSYQNKMMVDTLGMTIPFMVLYATISKSAQAMELSCRCMNLYMQHGINQRFGLPYHAVDLDSKLPEGSMLWSRGIGWYLLALGSLIQAQAPGFEKYSKSAHHVYETLRRYAPKLLFSGFVSETSPLDTSGTSMILLGLHWAGIDLGDLEGHIKELLRRIKHDGTVLSSLGDCPSLNTYALSYGYTPYGQAYTCMLVSEYLSSQHSDLLSGAQ